MFTLFGAILANSNLYKKTIFKEIPTKAMYQYEECLFCNTPKLLFNRNIISIFIIFQSKKMELLSWEIKLFSKRETDIHVMILAKACL